MALLSNGGVNLFVVIMAVSSVMAITWTGDGTQLHHQDGSRRDLVHSEEHEDGSCSYVLTVPKTCSCNCRDEFETMIETYERRLRSLEAFVYRLTAEEDDSTLSSSFQLFQSLGSSTASSSEDYDVMIEDDVRPKIPSTTKTPQKVTTRIPTRIPTRPQTTERVREAFQPHGIDESDEQVDDTSPPPTAQDEEDSPDSNEKEFTFPFVNFHMNTEGEDDPQQDEKHVRVDGMSGSIVFSMEKIPSSTSEIEILPPIESVKELQIYDVEFPDLPEFDPIPPSGIELSLAALNDDNLKTTIINDEVDEEDNNAKEVLNSPQQLLKPKKQKKPAKENGEDIPEEEPQRPVPGFVEGMEDATGYTGEFNKPQWKKLESFLHTTKNETAKRKRPNGLKREPSCEGDGCMCLRNKGRSESGIYYVPNPPLSGKRGVLVEVFCDLENEDGGWTVIQRRQNGSANFYRNWHHYAHGFGYLDASFWIGNRMLHALTKRYNYEIRIEFTDWDGKFGFAEYDRFYVGPEEDNFRLSLGKFVAGNRGNAFSYHNDTFFSTYDRDNDRSPGQCAVLRQAGFWFKNCNKMNPNGRWIPFADASGLNGAVVTWGTWSRHLFTYCLRDFRMMIRPTSPIDSA